MQLGILDRRCHEYLKTLQPLNEGQIFGATTEYLFRRTHLTSLDQYMLGPCCLKLFFCNLQSNSGLQETNKSTTQLSHVQFGNPTVLGEFGRVFVVDAAHLDSPLGSRTGFLSRQGLSK